MAPLATAQTILIIDDEPLSVAMLAHLLEEEYLSLIHI